MKFRKLRIAWSVWWGVVAVLLCVVWVHSYFSFDLLFVRSDPGGFQFTSTYGRLICIRWWNYSPDYVDYAKSFTYKPEPHDDGIRVYWPPKESAWGWSWGWLSGSDRVYPN